MVSNSTIRSHKRSYQSKRTVWSLLRYGLTVCSASLLLRMLDVAYFHSVRLCFRWLHGRKSLYVWGQETVVAIPLFTLIRYFFTQFCHSQDYWTFFSTVRRETTYTMSPCRQLNECRRKEHNIKTANKFFESVVKYRYLQTTLACTVTVLNKWSLSIFFR